MNGILNLSRSIGDLDYKNDNNLKVDEQKITVVPEIERQPLNQDCEFLVIACDGIWDCLTSQECAELVHENLPKKESIG